MSRKTLAAIGTAPSALARRRTPLSLPMPAGERTGRRRRSRRCQGVQPDRLHGVQLHVVDGARMASRATRDRTRGGVDRACMIRIGEVVVLVDPLIPDLGVSWRLVGGK